MLAVYSNGDSAGKQYLAEPVKLEDVFQLLYSTIQHDLTNTQTQTFANQLLGISLNFFNKLMRKLVHAERSSSSSSGKLSNASPVDGEILNSVISAISQLRGLVKDIDNRYGNLADDDVQSQEECRLMQIWETMTTIEIIKDAILNGRLPTCQQFLHDYRPHESAHWEATLQSGLRLVLHSLQNSNIHQASAFLTNMGFDASSELRKIYLFTTNKALRDYLTEELSKVSLLLPTEQEAAAFLQQMEELYSCPSFKKVKQMRIESDDTLFRKGSPAMQVLLSSDCHFPGELCLESEELCEDDVTNSECSAYSCMCLNWVLRWDRQTKEKILAERLIEMKSENRLRQLVSEEVLWDYLLCHGEWPRLRAWIQTYAIGNLTENMLTRLDNKMACTELVRERVCSTLAVQGLFRAAEVTEFRRLLRRLVLAQRLMDRDPHPLQNSSLLTVDDFHHMFAKFCIEKYLPHVMYSYTSRFSLTEASPCFASANLPDWVRMMLRFQEAGRNEADCNAVYQASRGNTLLVLGEDLDPVQLAMKQTTHIVGLADLLYCTTDIRAELQKRSIQEKEAIKCALKDYPTLHAAIFSKDPPGGIPPADITLYHLLQGNCPFDISRLFLWQSSNTLCCQDGDKKLPLMPTFNNPELSNFAYKKDLSFLYYLKHGRPSFAAISLLAQDETVLSGRAPSRRGLQNACWKAYLLALKNFHKLKITAACSAFLDFLGESSLALRTDVQVANLMLAHFMFDSNICTAETNGASEHLCTGEITELFIALLKRDREAGYHIQERLSLATYHHIKHNLKSSMEHMEVVEAWRPAVLFAQIHCLPLPTDFLLDCTVQNDWLCFIVCAELFQYPRQQLQKVAQTFRNPHLREHIQCAIQNADIISQPKDVAQKKVSSKKHFLKRQEIRSEELDVSSGSDKSEEDDIVFEENEFTVMPKSKHPEETVEPSNNIVSILLDVQQNSSKPWKTLLDKAHMLQSPILALLASCMKDFPDSQIISCLCLWLLGHLTLTAREKATCHITDLVNHEWCLGDLSVIMDVTTELGFLKNLVLAFVVFQDDSPLLPFLHFLEAFWENESEEECTKYIHNFKEKLKKYCKDTSTNSKLVGDHLWFESVTVTMVKTMLMNESLGNTVNRFLHLIVETDMTAGFSLAVDCDFACILKLMSLTTETMLNVVNVKMKMESLLYSKEVFNNECSRVVMSLQDAHLFLEARQFAEAAGLPIQPIILSEAAQNLYIIQNSPLWEDLEARKNFWHNCSKFFTQSCAVAKTAADFFKENAMLCPENSMERVQLLRLTIYWLRDNTRPYTYHMEEVMYSQWLTLIRIQAGKLDEISTSSLDIDDVLPNAAQVRSMMLTREKTFGCFGETSCPQRETLLNKEIVALEHIIGLLLDHFCVKEACSLAQTFQHNSKDLTAIKTCMELAEGMITLAEIDYKTLDILHVSFERPSVVGMERDVSVSNLLPLPVVDADILSAMKHLKRCCQHGQQCCQRIITSYQVASVLGRSHESVMTAPCFDILRNLLLEDELSYFTLAKEFVRGSGVDDSEISAFIADAVIHSLKIYTGAGGKMPSEISPRSSSELLFNPSDSSESFCHLACLCSDTSQLGNLLVNAASAVSRSETPSKAMLSMQVELLIRAHDCYTVSCHMEGISRVLHLARKCNNALNNADEHSLMIRLLTGIARYSEMTYVFDILQQKQQLILLLRKGVEKDYKLKVALLDHLKKCFPGDRDTYTMVALHFTMFREIAEMLEDAAYTELERYASRLQELEANADAQNHLQDIAQYFIDAAQSYSKEECLRRAATCWQMARVVALQIQLLPVRKRVVCLESPNQFISKHSNFHEAVVVANAYDCPVDWGAALFNNAVVAGNDKYLDDMKSAGKLSASLISDVCQKYLTEKSKTNCLTGNVKKVLNYCSDPFMRYQLASQLGYTDICSQLLSSDVGPSLKDRFAILL